MREKVKLLSSAGTGHFYVATKNKRLHPDKSGQPGHKKAPPGNWRGFFLASTLIHKPLVKWLNLGAAAVSVLLGRARRTGSLAGGFPPPPTTVRADIDARG
jgi:hypothetical protein